MKKKKRPEIQYLGNSLAVQWLGRCAFTAEGRGSVPGWGTKIPQATQHSPRPPQKIYIVSFSYWLYTQGKI